MACRLVFHKNRKDNHPEFTISLMGQETVLDIDYNEITFIRVFNLRGSLLATIPVTSNYLKWNRPARLSNGVYIVQAIGVNKRYQFKIILSD